MDLVESVGFQEPLISCSYEDLHPQWSCALIPVELVRTTRALKYMLQHLMTMPAENKITLCQVLIELSKSTALHGLIVQQCQENQQLIN